MKPYGLRNKLKFNFIDNHYFSKDYVNWWEEESKDVIKKRERQKIKKELKTYF